MHFGAWSREELGFELQRNFDEFDDFDEIDKFDEFDEKAKQRMEISVVQHPSLVSF